MVRAKQQRPTKKDGVAVTVNHNKEIQDLGIKEQESNIEMILEEVIKMNEEEILEATKPKKSSKRKRDKKEDAMEEEKPKKKAKKAKAPPDPERVRKGLQSRAFAMLGKEAHQTAIVNLQKKHVFICPVTGVTHLTTYGVPINKELPDKQEETILFGSFSSPYAALMYLKKLMEEVSDDSIEDVKERKKNAVKLNYLKNTYANTIAFWFPSKKFATIEKKLEAYEKQKQFIDLDEFGYSKSLAIRDYKPANFIAKCAKKLT